MSDMTEAVNLGLKLAERLAELELERQRDLDVGELVIEQDTDAVEPAWLVRDSDGVVARFRQYESDGGLAEAAARHCADAVRCAIRGEREAVLSDFATQLRRVSS